MIRVVVVDDHFLVRMGLTAVLAGETDMKVVGEADNAAATAALLESTSADVALVDLRLPGCDGVDLTKTIRQRWPAVRVIILSTWSGDEDIFRSLQAGASGYLLKSLPREDLLAAIRQVHEGKRCLPEQVVDRLSSRRPGNELTPRELDVLRQIVRGFNNREIGTRLGIAEGTVKLHVNSLLGKLGVPDRTNAAVVALHRGIVHLD